VTIGGQTFTVTQAGATCTYTLSSTSQSVAASGGSYMVNITAPSNCSWAVSSSATWLTVTAGITTSGPGNATFTAAANTGTTSRTGTMTIAGQTFTVTQAGATSCAVTLSTTARTISAKAASGSLYVTNPSGCQWTATSSATWLTVTCPGQGAVSYAATANPVGSNRSGRITIGGATFTLTQRADSSPNSPSNLHVVSSGE
jgi:hypothetical protein